MDSTHKNIAPKFLPEEIEERIDLANHFATYKALKWKLIIVQDYVNK